MKIFSFLLFITIFLFGSFSVKATVINDEISKKYSKIFSQNILSDADINDYKKVFEHQEACEWKKANKYILEIENNILMGHVLAQRYLHPKCYRSKYLELYSWLKKYNDHPQARKIYRLAVKRMPQGYKSPPQPSNAVGIEKTISEPKKNTKYVSQKKLSKNQRKEKKKLINAIKSRVNKGWPTGAVKLLKQRDVTILLDQVEIDQQKELIAKGYFLADKNELAIQYASEALKKSALHVPYAGWTAGLSSWRLKNYEQAAEFFSNFAISLKEDVWHQASGSFWVARAYVKLNQYEDINFWLKRAADNPESFYGLLAAQILGIENSINWDPIKLGADEKMILSLPAGKRIQALIQIGLLNELENEIIKINSVMNEDIAMWSLDIAQHFSLAYTQLKIVGKLQQYNVLLPTKYYYPTPIWQPLNGFTLDPSLLYAFMHQESMFNTTAKSHRGAVGLMQIMPATAKFISSSREVKRNNSNILKIPEINLDVGQEYIEYLLNLKLVNNNLIYLAAAYNGGPGNLEKWLKKINHLDDALFFMESIPSRETRWFIEKVLTKYWIYEDKIGNKSNSLRKLANGENPIY
ncbi:MAG: lytic transglycosylase domain-containing protein [Pelagibacteraceae bacterium]|jgi:soluble lytic murein transglycosylase-like protein|nr:lytic transglycosylase domain-containing protein [Pelagibacteraceae bacterium]MDP6785161.1 lytic transglycosylase domain-containing protein [Alphaproteobacteria bacterium]MBO6467200.1 lytic transglycosylase domain-containing protein [Pelagibacteraceae bacterium]MBO6470589.1 lytic transglycosylase domain-containing protein [Pelagibacteraceae bacterium]MBO6471344.1 lytic transglycosylase domain-containing protein [Pelagibacteraceae bacterium]